jgi:hypothetical protein
LATSNEGLATSDNNFFEWEGPGYDEWLADWNTGDPVYGLDTLPGWGANIEVFSRPSGFALHSNGVDYLMTNGILGFAVINRTTPNNTRIASVDLYLNERWTWTIDGSGTGAGGKFDIETVVLHEMGHAMGLDHPNETIDGGCSSVCNDSPNFSTIRHSVSDDERGGLAFLYPPLPGDINGDFVVNSTDVAYSIADSVGILSLDAYSLRAADFIDVDGIVGIVETTKIIRDVYGTAQRQAPFGGPGEVPTFGELEIVQKENSVVPLTTWCVPSPADAGLGGRVEIEIRVDIPSSAESQSYSFDLSYDPTVFQNPRVVEYNPMPGSSFVWEITEPGTIRIRRNGITDTTYGQAKLATVLLDADFVMAVASTGPLFTMDDLSFVPVDSDPPRLYGDDVDESVVLVATPMFANDYDVTRDGVIDIEDLFEWYSSPIDVDRDGDTDVDDVRTLETAIRMLEGG